MRSTRKREALGQAWTILVGMFRQLKPLVQHLNEIELCDAVPVLSRMRGVELPVPGSQRLIVENFAATAEIIHSKQRPRRLGVLQSDGTRSDFLLKAHEDTRLDQRVMQFLALVNALLAGSSCALKEQMMIETYRVLPLTREVGLIGWIPACRSLWSVVQDQRERGRMSLESAAVNPLELRRFILATANDSAHWVRRRTAYSATLASTSIAGFTLGLGDRHLGNIMILRTSGRQAHIGFGDCFETRKRREKFPELVPFRLTRLLLNALEISRTLPGGTFRTCANDLVRLLRENTDSLLSLFSVFVRDPLWQAGVAGSEAVEQVKAKLTSPVTVEVQVE